MKLISLFEKLFVGAGLLAIVGHIVLICGFVYGYVSNIISLVSMVTQPTTEFTVLLLARFIGLFFFPLGGILGYF